MMAWKMTETAATTSAECRRSASVSMVKESTIRAGREMRSRMSVRPLVSVSVSRPRRLAKTPMAIITSSTSTCSTITRTPIAYLLS